jgi:phospholipid-binding lipoprotein MlaA
MKKKKWARLVLTIVAASLLSACVTLPPNHPRTPQDPWESWNRGVYKVNDELDKAIAKPVTKAYVRYTPSPIRTGVTNFFSNLATVRTALNDALQGKFKASATDLGRFLLNATVGVGGLMDPASSAGLDHNIEDFGLTLGHWGVPAGPYFMLPVLGPSDTRDAPARLVDFYTNPLHYISNNYIGYGLYLPELVDARASLLPLDETIQRAYDPYAFVRNAYLARRAYLISGKSPEETEEPLVDPDAPKADETIPAGTEKTGPPAAPPRTPPPPPPR